MFPFLWLPKTASVPQSEQLYANSSQLLLTAAFRLTLYWISLRHSIRLCLHKENPCPKSKSKLRLYYDWRSVGQTFLVSCTHMGAETNLPSFSDRPQTFAGLLMWDAVSKERLVCSLQLLLVLASAVFLGSEFRKDSWPYFWCLTFETPPTCH
jgi:hypothetical protein